MGFIVNRVMKKVNIQPGKHYYMAHGSHLPTSINDGDELLNHRFPVMLIDQVGGFIYHKTHLIFAGVPIYEMETDDDIYEVHCPDHFHHFGPDGLRLHEFSTSGGNRDQQSPQGEKRTLGKNQRDTHQTQRSTPGD